MLKDKWSDLIDLQIKFNLVLKELDVKTSDRNRFDTAFSLLQDLENARATGKIDSLAGTRLGHMRFALRDIGDIQRILHGISLYTGDTSLLAKKLSKMLGGSHSPTTETHNNSEPRNVQFELVLLSDLLISGLKAYLREPNPDIEVIVVGRVYSIECKRVFSDSDHSVQDNVGSALKQLLKIIGDDQRKRGIVALAIERRLNGGDKILVAQNENVARQRLDYEIQQFIFKYVHRWSGKAIKTPRQVGVLIFAGISGSLNDEEIMINATQLGATNTSPIEKLGYARSLFDDFKKDIAEPLKARADQTRGPIIT